MATEKCHRLLLLTDCRYTNALSMAKLNALMAADGSFDGIRLLSPEGLANAMAKPQYALDVALQVLSVLACLLARLLVPSLPSRSLSLPRSLYPPFLSACLPVCLSACLSTCLSLSVSVRPCLSLSVSTCLCLPLLFPSCRCVSLSVSVRVCLFLFKCSIGVRLMTRGGRLLPDPVRTKRIFQNASTTIHFTTVDIFVQVFNCFIRRYTQ